MLARHRRSPKNLTVNRIYNNFQSTGVINSFHNPPWEEWGAQFALSESDINGLNIIYHTVQSGGKFASPLLYLYLDDDGHITNDGAALVANAILSRFRLKWTRLWEDYNIEYNPLYTYNMTIEKTRAVTDNTTSTDNITEEITEEGTNTRTLNLAHSSESDSTQRESTTNRGTVTTAKSDTIAHGKTISTSGSSTSNKSINRFGFNTSDNVPVPYQTESETVTNSGSEQEGGTTTDTGQSTVTNDLITTVTGETEDTASGTNTGTVIDDNEVTTGGETNSTGSVDRDIEESSSDTRVGLMYRSAAEILSLDRDFWLNDYFSIVFSDIDSLITLPIFSEREPNIWYY